VTQGVIYEDLAHQIGGNPKEMSPVLAAHTGLVYQPEIRLVDQGCGLQGVIRTLTTEIMTGQSAQLIVDQGHQPGEDFPVAIAPIDEQLGYLFGTVPHGRERVGEERAQLLAIELSLWKGAVF